jgi:hypothetical protein
MLSFRDFRFGSQPKAAAENAAAVPILEDRNPYLAKVDKIVDDFVSQLKSALMQGSLVSAKPTMWDSFKKGVSNLFYGKDNPKNPYAGQNRFGNLGRAVESVTNIHIPLDDYKKIREAFELFEADMSAAMALPSGTANLQIMKIIDSKAADLKQKLRDLMNAVGSKMPSADRPKKTEPALKGISPYNRSPDPIAEPAPSVKPEPVEEPVPEPVKDAYHFEKLPRTNKKWDELTVTEKEVWNYLGGGQSPRSHRSRAGFDLPKILRLGDPRLKEIERSGNLKWYKDRHRVESKDNPIKSKSELETALNKVRSNAGEREPEATTMNPTVRPTRQRTRVEPSAPTSPAPAQRDLPFDQNPDAPAVTTLPQEETAEYKGYKKVAEKIVDKHAWSKESDKAELEGLIAGGPDKQEELQEKIKDILNKAIENEADESEKTRLKSKVGEADTAEKLQELADELYFSFLDHTRHLVDQFRKLCHG